MNVPFIDLKAQYRTIQKDIDTRLSNALHNFQFAKGPEVSEFENEFARRIGVNHCIATGNGTDSLFLALKAIGVQHGDEVITPAFSWISSSEVITLCGAKPVFADVYPDTFTIDIADVRRRITSKTKAIIAVHLFGHLAEVAKLQDLCAEFSLKLVEDCAQAHFTSGDSQYAGTYGKAAAFSFYPTKNLGAYGDAGCVLTNDSQLAEKIRRWANHGALYKDDHLFEGINSRMDTLQAAVLLSKLTYVENWNLIRRQKAHLYMSLLRHITELTLPSVAPDTVHTFHLFVIKAKRRDELKAFLTKNSIETFIHYPTALPFTKAYSYPIESDFPVAAELQNQVLSLPLYPELEDHQITYVCQQISTFYS